MFKAIFRHIFYFVTQPGKAWASVAGKEANTEKLLSAFLYPVFGMITLAAFIGAFWATSSFEVALKASIREFVAFFAGFYLASFLLKYLMRKQFTEQPLKLCRHFVAYASSLIYIISMASSLLNGFGLLYLFLPYTIYMIWEGAGMYLSVREEDQVKFTVFASLIIASPYLIAFVINKFMLIAPHHATT